MLLPSISSSRFCCDPDALQRTDAPSYLVPAGHPRWRHLCEIGPGIKENFLNRPWDYLLYFLGLNEINSIPKVKVSSNHFLYSKNQKAPVDAGTKDQRRTDKTMHHFGVNKVDRQRDTRSQTIVWGTVCVSLSIHVPYLKESVLMTQDGSIGLRRNLDFF